MSEAACLALIYSSLLVIPFMWHVVIPLMWLVEIFVGVRAIDATIYYIQLEIMEKGYAK